MKNTDRDLSKLHPDFRKKVDMFMKEVEKTVFITEAYRSAERQQYLFNKGATFLNGTAGNESQHQLGRAVDIAFNGAELYPSKHSKWEDIAKIARTYGMDWGYDLWSHTGFIDKPHFQDNMIPLISKKSYEDLENENTILRDRADKVELLLEESAKILKPNK